MIKLHHFDETLSGQLNQQMTIKSHIPIAATSAATSLTIIFPASVS